jgi:glycosyltransferase involved in cell wall biosynthesis
VKIDYVLSTYPSTPEVFIYREIKELLDNGHTVRVLCLRPKLLQKNQSLNYITGEVEVIYPSSNPFSYLVSTIFLLLHGKSVFLTLEFFRSLPSLLSKKSLFKILFSGFCIDNLSYRTKYSRQPFNHLHSHHLFLSTYACYQFAKLHSATYSLTLHTLSCLYSESLLKNILSKAVFLRTISSEIEPHFNLLLQDKSKFHHITNGIDPAEFVFNPIVNIESRLNLIAVGALYDKKGFDTLIFACSKLRDYGINFSCGIFGEGPERKKLEHLILSLSLNDQVEIRGFRKAESIIKKIADSDMLIMPSRLPSRSTRDGLPTVIIEAMASGTPVIASNFAGIPDIVKHRITGLLVQPEDHREIANAIVELLYNNDLRATIIENARSLVNNEYYLKKNVYKLVSLFEHSRTPHSN